VRDLIARRKNQELTMDANTVRKLEEVRTRLEESSGFEPTSQNWQRYHRILDQADKLRDELLWSKTFITANSDSRSKKRTRAAKAWVDGVKAMLTGIKAIKDGADEIENAV